MVRMCDGCGERYLGEGYCAGSAKCRKSKFHPEAEMRGGRRAHRQARDAAAWAAAQEKARAAAGQQQETATAPWFERSAAPAAAAQDRAAAAAAAGQQQEPERVAAWQILSCRFKNSYGSSGCGSSNCTVAEFELSADLLESVAPIMGPHSQVRGYTGRRSKPVGNTSQVLQSAAGSRGDTATNWFGCLQGSSQSVR